ncbi:MAG: TetR family transcriptional regulator, partial [Pseudomonadota bacterium]
MARIAKKKAKDRRAEIVSAAQSILANDGAGALTLRAIANEVGIKLASLQYYFPTYAALVEALVDKTVETYSEGLRFRIDKDLSAEARLLQTLKWLSTPVEPDCDLA